MTVGALAPGVDPLIAEAKRHARRRYLFALAALVVVTGAAVGTSYSLRSAAGKSLGLCTTVPSGWQEKAVSRIPHASPIIWLTNSGFGPMNDLYPLSDRLPAHGVIVTVINFGRRNPRGVKEVPLRFTRADFLGLEGSTHPSGGITVRSQGVVLSAYVEVGKLTPATLAAANQALSGVRTCSA
jgi:hypothetical protein